MAKLPLILLLTQLSLISLNSCFPRPGWTDEEAMTMYFTLAYKNYLKSNPPLGEEASSVDAVSAMTNAGLLTKEKYNSKFIRNGIPVDLWGNPLVFSSAPISRGKNDIYLIHFYSVGPNGIDEKMKGDDLPPRWGE